MESFKESCFRAMVELGGGHYQGIQRGFPGHPESLIYFCGPCGSTLALKPSEVSAAAVRRRIADKEEEYAAFQQIPEQVWVSADAA